IVSLKEENVVYQEEEEDPYEEAAQQLFEQAPHSPEYVPRDHVPVFVLEFEHPEDLVPAEDEAPASLLPPGFLSPRAQKRLWRGESIWAGKVVKRLLSFGPYELLGFRLLRNFGEFAQMVPKVVVRCTRKLGEEMGGLAGKWGNRKDRAAVRAEIEVLRSERLAYEQEGIQTREALAKSEAYCRALEARVAVLVTHTRRLKWQRQVVDDFAVQHIMRTQALEARARDDTLEDTGSSS
nr:hypothetical protein [Tanacetum cinerariifolium]